MLKIVIMKLNSNKRRIDLIILIGVLLIGFGIESKGQVAQWEDSRVTKKYEVWVKYGHDVHDSAPQIHGRLMALDESSIMIRPHTNEKVLYTLDISEIESLEFRTTNGKVGAIIGGGLIGLLVGTGIGASSSNPYDLSKNFGQNVGKSVSQTSGGGLVGLVAGATMGALVSSKRISISINGNYETYARKRTDLQEFLWVVQ
jgi:hypothetical protein